MCLTETAVYILYTTTEVTPILTGDPNGFRNGKLYLRQRVKVTLYNKIPKLSILRFLWRYTKKTQRDIGILPQKL